MDGVMNANSSKTISYRKLIHLPILSLYWYVSPSFIYSLLFVRLYRNVAIHLRHSQGKEGKKPGFRGTSTKIPFPPAKHMNRQDIKVKNPNITICSFYLIPIPKSYPYVYKEIIHVSLYNAMTRPGNWAVNHYHNHKIRTNLWDKIQNQEVDFSVKNAMKITIWISACNMQHVHTHPVWSSLSFPEMSMQTR